MTVSGTREPRLPPRPEALNWSESRLHELCRRTFLSLWSYPGVHKDQGTGGGKRGGKEVCDLLVVFEDHVIIFSDKTCTFPSTGRIELDWARWYGRAVTQSVRQLRGAERWIREHPRRLFLDARCEHSFPYDLPDPSSAKVHRIVVAGGAAERCQAELGGRGSLMLRFGERTGDVPQPFCLEQPDDGEGFVHVLNEVTLEITLKALDTISDFIGYLTAKERLITSGKQLFAAGEEDLLARYLKHTGPDGTHDFAFPPKFDAILLEEGGWDELLQNPQWTAKRRADEVSYAWDRLIEKFAYFAGTGEAQFADGMGIREFEQGLRFLAREPRVKRRALADSLLGIMAQARPGQERATRVLMPMGPDDPYYVFLALDRPSAVSHEDYRVARRELLGSLCLATRARWPEARDIVGIATEPLDSEDRSEDLLYFDGQDWDEALAEDAEEVRARLGLFSSLRLRQGNLKEYPVGPPGRLQPIRRTGMDVGRNDPCPCRSGKKYKRCCG